MHPTLSQQRALRLNSTLAGLAARLRRARAFCPCPSALPDYDEMACRTHRVVSYVERHMLPTFSIAEIPFSGFFLFDSDLKIELFFVKPWANVGHRKLTDLLSCGPQPHRKCVLDPVERTRPRESHVASKCNPVPCCRFA